MPSSSLESATPAPGLPGKTPRTPPRKASFEASAAARRVLSEAFYDSLQKDTWPLTAVLRLLAVCAVVALCSWSGIVLSHQSEGVATIWLSNGVLFGLLITQPPSRWLAYFFAGLLADTAADVLYGDPFRIAIGVSLANSVEVITSTLGMTFVFGHPLDLAKRRPLVGFLLICVVCAAALTSVLGAAWTMLFEDAGPFPQLWRTWYLGDMLGMAILGPTLVILQRVNVFAILHRDHLLRTAAILLVPTLTTIVVFTHNGDPLIFLLFPAFLLVAFRLGYPGTVLNVLVVALLAIGFTVKGHGPLMLITGQHMLLHRIVVAQLFVATTIFTMFPVAALLEEKEALKLSLAASEQTFRDMAHCDELTGLFNRRAFNLELERAWTNAAETKETLALILLDADLFKQYNDINGHILGDECLRVIATALRDVVRTSGGVAARFGGEEFAVILPGVGKEGGRRVAESIRQAAAARRLPNPATPSGVQTVSLGVAALVPELGQSNTELVKLADTALYAAKVLGRNQVACA